jgi:hypothetical protein
MSEGLGKRTDWWIRRWVRLKSLSLAMSSPVGIDVDVRVSCAWRASKS